MQLRGRVEQVSGPTGAPAIEVGAGEFHRTPSGQLPAIVKADFALDWKVCGSGVLTWSVFRLYRVTLHAPGAFDADRPFAIDLSYLRRIPAAQIVVRAWSWRVVLFRFATPGGSLRPEVCRSVRRNLA